MSEAKPKLYMASIEEVRRGGTADVYFRRIRRVLEKAGLCDVRVRLELHVYKLPRGYSWAVFAGLEEALALLEGIPGVTVYSVPEGTLFKAKDPLMVIEAPYCRVAELETAILGVLRHESSIATKAARVKLAAGDKPVLFFGLRALHPAVAPMADRAALVGGVDGVAGVAAEKYLGVKPTGTMPHAYIIVVGDPVKAWRLFDEYVEPDVPRIALADTFYDERYESLLAAEALGEKLYGVRLDTPSSRRGDMRAIVEEVKWTLKIHGYEHVKVLVSGGLDEEQVCRLRDVADGFGVGTSIAFPPSIDISMDVVEVERGGEWIPIAKRGKLPGARELHRCCGEPLNHCHLLLGRGGRCCSCSEEENLMVKYMEDGRLVRRVESLEEVRRRVLEQLKRLEDPCKSSS